MSYSTKSIAHREQHLVGRILQYMVVVFVIVISVLPILWMLLSSFKNNMEVLNSALSWPSSFSLDAYFEAVKVSHLEVNYVNSILVSVLSTAAGLLIFAMGSYVLARCEFKGRGLIFGILVSALLVSSNAMIQPIYVTINFLHLYDTKLGLGLVYTALGLPVSIFILKSGFSTLPKEMEESASIEGAGFLTTFFRIILPMAKAPLSSAAVLLFLACWNEFIFAVMLTSSKENRTLPVALQFFDQAFSYDYPSMFAALVMAIVPSIAVYFLLQEQIVESLVSGAIKG